MPVGFLRVSSLTLARHRGHNHHFAPSGAFEHAASLLQGVQKQRGALVSLIRYTQ